MTNDSRIAFMALCLLWGLNGVPAFVSNPWVQSSGAMIPSTATVSYTESVRWASSSEPEQSGDDDEENSQDDVPVVNATAVIGDVQMDEDSLDEEGDEEPVETLTVADKDEPATNNNVVINGSMDAALSEELLEEFESEPIMPMTDTELMECLLFIQSLGAMTGRGEQASDGQMEAVRGVVAKLEQHNPTPEPAYAKDLLQGTWALTFTDTRHLFRSSPFFMAGRAVCSTPEQAQQFDWFCTMHRQALAISQIGAVRQIISEDKLVSEFETKAGAVPFLSDFTPFMYSGGLPVTIDGAIVSTADYTTLNGTAAELYMDTVEIKGSNLPCVRQVLDAGLSLQSRMLGDFLEANLDNYQNPRPVIRTTYLSDKMRILRDIDDNIFVYTKTSASTEPTDYSSIEADLGIPGLLEGFNKAVTKFGL